MSKEHHEAVPPMEGISEDASRNTLALNPLVGILVAARGDECRVRCDRLRHPSSARGN